ncbi:MAG: L,D-transpeptidase [Candidatus Dormibacteraeota bacterium]|nr:L,D-transpeptidase [Candidatus Dormibacteraeota bacterium]MBV9525794.1 L,D-transpeptidase [Candidatus Dormibacteraeota bacterium]
MRLLHVAAAGVAIAVVAGAAGVSVVGASRQSNFSSRANSLERTWTADIAAGVPERSIAPLRAQLQSSQYESPWWSPAWWTSTGASLLDDLQRRTASAWDAAMANGRADAQEALDSWTQLTQQLGSFVPASAVSQEATWPAQLQAAPTPTALAKLAAAWAGAITAARQQAQANELNAQVGDFGGVSGLMTAAQAALSTAQSDNLDAGQLQGLITTVQDDLRNHTDATQDVDQLLSAVKAERSLITLNDNVGAGVRPVMLSVDQAAAEQTPNAQSFQSQYQTAVGAFHAAMTTAQLTAVQQQISSLQSAVNQELSSDQCGHNVGSGKVITVNLTLQEAVFYQDGCEVQATPVTTGRALLRTPTGTFHVFNHQSPFQFISPWPKGSPFYYYPSWVSWVMEFAAGGYFLHDAPWEPSWQYGPGSEDSSGASHGCIHIPTSVMGWAYHWTPDGTPVIISS